MKTINGGASQECQYFYSESHFPFFQQKKALLDPPCFLITFHHHHCHRHHRHHHHHHHPINLTLLEAMSETDRWVWMVSSWSRHQSSSSNVSPARWVLFLGTSGRTKTDESSEKFRTAFDLTLSFLENHVAIIFSANFILKKPCLKVQNMQTNFFGLKMSHPAPLHWNFPKIHPFC